jgi:hypothetical protein
MVKVVKKPISVGFPVTTLTLVVSPVTIFTTYLLTTRSLVVGCLEVGKNNPNLCINISLSIQNLNIIWGFSLKKVKGLGFRV